MSQRPARKLRTWSRFGQIRRVPSEYEIVTHDTNYTTREGRAAALETNPTAPANMWFLTYRDHSPLSVEDWHGFRDPDELTYRKYVTMQDEQETVVEGILDEFGKVNHDANQSPEWLQVLATVFTPMRFPAHALQMTQAYLGQIAPSSYITNCSAFAAADLLRQVSLVAYRTRQLQMAYPDIGFATGERHIWEMHPGWQPTRRALENALIAYDWGECLTAVNLVLRPTLSEILLRQLGIVADANHDQLTWLLLSNLAIDAERNARWSAALARYAISKRPENASVLWRWVQRWTPKADEAAAALALMLSELPEVGREADTMRGAAKTARERVLSDAGILAPV
jgi:Methane/Phenol/Toluene Hydroxylase